MVQSLDEYQILLVPACLAYEYKDIDEFKHQPPNDQLRKLKSILASNNYLYHEKKFKSIEQMTTLIFPVYYGQSFFEVMKQSSFVEGDLIRLFSQILDKIGQIRKASLDMGVWNKMQNCEGIIKKMLEGIYLV